MAIYLVDYENTHYLGGISGLSANDTVVVFYTQNSSSLSFDAHKEILQAQAKILYKYVDNGGKNALDFQLSTYLGCLIGEKQADEQQLYIVSKDKGFYYVSKFWEREKGIRVTVVPSLTEQPKAKQQQSAREETQTATIGQIVAATVVEQGETAETVGNAAEETTAVESEIANVETEVATTIENATDGTAATEESAATNDGTAENADDIAEENTTTKKNRSANNGERHGEQCGKSYRCRKQRFPTTCAKDKATPKAQRQTQKQRQNHGRTATDSRKCAYRQRHTTGRWRNSRDCANSKQIQGNDYGEQSHQQTAERQRQGRRSTENSKAVYEEAGKINANKQSLFAKLCLFFLYGSFPGDVSPTLNMTQTTEKSTNF